MNELNNKGNAIFAVFVVAWYILSYFVGEQVGKKLEEKYPL